MAITFADLINSTTIFDRAAQLTFGPRRVPSRCGGELAFDLMEAEVHLHPDLPATTVWTYDGQFPGPTVEVRSGDRVELLVRNQIRMALPYDHVVVEDGPDKNPNMNEVGSQPASTDAADVKERDSARDLTACCVTHLHGAPTLPDSDGWTESVITEGEEARHHYEFPRETFTTEGGGAFARRGGAAPLFWFHDHAMGATRFNNYAGLAGVWIVRDPLEEEIGLPTDYHHELPLVLQDRNLETCDGIAASELTGALLHKVQKGVRECFAPATLVNGKLWPRVEVKPCVYRLRLLNGSNARFFRLHFFGLKDKADQPPYIPLDPECVQQIGTDGGLLKKAVPLVGDALLLAPAERADVLIDFGLAVQRHGVQHVVVFNSADAPFGPDTGTPEKPWEPDTANLRRVPQVLRFDVTSGQVTPGLNGRAIADLLLDPEFEPLPSNHDDLPPHGHSLVVLREEDEVIRDERGNPVDVDGMAVSYHRAARRTMLFLHEMMFEDDADRMGMNMTKLTDDGGTPQGIRVILNGPSGPESYVTVARRFTDATTIFIEKGAWHMWKILNLSPDAHPFHVHLTQLQALTRQQFAPTAGEEIAKASFEFDLTAPDGEPASANDPGWKDTFRVYPGERGKDDAVKTAEMLTIFGQFKQHAGRYMYHCHILEHEDADMMRPFVVTPMALMRFMAHGGMAHHATIAAPKPASARLR